MSVSSGRSRQPRVLIAEMKASYSDLLGNKAFGSIVIVNALSVTRTLAMAITHDTPKTTGNEMCAVRWGYHRTRMVSASIGPSCSKRVVLRHMCGYQFEDTVYLPPAE